MNTFKLSSGNLVQERMLAIYFLATALTLLPFWPPMLLPGIVTLATVLGLVLLGRSAESAAANLKLALTAGGSGLLATSLGFLTAFCGVFALPFYLLGHPFLVWNLPSLPLVVAAMTLLPTVICWSGLELKRWMISTNRVPVS